MTLAWYSWVCGRMIGHDITCSWRVHSALVQFLGRDVSCAFSSSRLFGLTKYVEGVEGEES